MPTYPSSRITAGELAVGDSAGDVYKLAEHYGCTVGTVQQAEKLLVD